MLNTIAATLGMALAFSSMVLSWYILMPRKKKQEEGAVALIDLAGGAHVDSASLVQRWGIGLIPARAVSKDPDPHARCRRNEEHTSELQSLRHLVCRLLL